MVVKREREKTVMKMMITKTIKIQNLIQRDKKKGRKGSQKKGNMNKGNMNKGGKSNDNAAKSEPKKKSGLSDDVKRSLV